MSKKPGAKAKSWLNYVIQYAYVDPQPEPGYPSQQPSQPRPATPAAPAEPTTKRAKAAARRAHARSIEDAATDRVSPAPAPTTSVPARVFGWLGGKTRLQIEAESWSKPCELEAGVDVPSDDNARIWRLGQEARARVEAEQAAAKAAHKARFSRSPPRKQINTDYAAVRRRWAALDAARGLGGTKGWK